MLTDERDLAIRRSFERQGLLRSFGARMTALSPGRCVIEIPFSPQVTQQHGFFHGGVIGALADTSGGYAAMTRLPEGRDGLTLEYKVNFLRPASGEVLVATGEVLRAGRSIIVTRVDVHVRRADATLLCAAVQQSIVPAEAAEI